MKPSDDNDVVLIPTSGSDQFIGFAVQIDGERAGTVTFRHEDKSRASIRWNLTDEHQGQLARVLKQAVDHAFAEHSITRVETQIDAEDHEAIRQAALAAWRIASWSSASIWVSTRVMLCSAKAWSTACLRTRASCPWCSSVRFQRIDARDLSSCRNVTVPARSPSICTAKPMNWSEPDVGISTTSLSSLGFITATHSCLDVSQSVNHDR